MNLSGYERVCSTTRKSSVFLLSGGIGNQLFQYCLALRVGKEEEITPILDHTLLSLSHRSSNQRPTILKLPLQHIDWIDNSSRIANLLAQFSHSRSRRFSNQYLSSVKQLADKANCNFFMQNSTLYDSDIRPASQSIYVGSFTSYLYWAEYVHSFLQIIDTALNEYSRKQAHSIDSNLSEIVIHARRGDYSRNTKTKRIHGVYGIDYYMEALERFSEGRKTVSVLSDDIKFAWTLAREIGSQFPSMKASASTGSDPLLLLGEYSKSSLFIGSNSTFSWWLSSLGADKIRVLPFRWFDEGQYGFNAEEFFPLKTDLLNFPFETT